MVFIMSLSAYFGEKYLPTLAAAQRKIVEVRSDAMTASRNPEVSILNPEIKIMLKMNRVSVARIPSKA